MTERCQESWGHITPAGGQTHQQCWGCGAMVQIESYKHPRYGTSYKLAEHSVGVSDESGWPCAHMVPTCRFCGGVEKGTDDAQSD